MRIKDDRVEKIKKHLSYEVWMLCETYELTCKLKERPETNEKRIDANMKIESFCVHARNLYEFFLKKRPRDEYVPRGYTSAEADYDEPMRLLNTQISHLIYEGRTEEPARQISGADRLAMLNDLRTELERFRAAMIDRKLARTFQKIPTNLTVMSFSTVSAVTTSSATNYSASPGTIAPRNKRLS